jgi:hypothetical protein
MEPRRKRTARRATRSVKEKTAVLSLPHIAELIGYGQIAVGEKYPMGCIATADDGHNTLAMLKRRKGESLAQLLIRLDQAIVKANDEGVFTDEINLLPKSGYP